MANIFIFVLCLLIRNCFSLTNFADTKCGKRSISPLPKISRISRIVGGAEAVRGEFPWMVSLQFNTGPPESSHFCGGFLISNRYVVTAAHCLGFSKDRIQVIIGEHVIGLEEVPLNAFAVPVERIIQHPEYSGKPVSQNDIGLLRLKDAVEWNPFVQPACLPNAGDVVQDGEKTLFAGWGYSSSDSPSSSKTLLTVDVPVVSRRKCEEEYDGEWVGSDSQLCAGAPYEGRGGCQGDSGSPLMRWVDSNESLSVVGVYSGGGNKCGAGMTSGIYTHLASYVNWIKYNVK